MVLRRWVSSGSLCPVPTHGHRTTLATHASRRCFLLPRYVVDARGAKPTTNQACETTPRQHRLHAM